MGQPVLRETATAAADALSPLDSFRAVRIRRNHPLAPHTTIAVGGPADWFIEIGDDSALTAVMDHLRAQSVPWFILGGGSNTFFDSAGFRGAVIRLGGEFRAVHMDESGRGVIAGAGAPLSGVMNFARRNGLSGLEFCCGIPGSVGGALAGNSGAGGEDVCSLAASVSVLEADGRIHRLRRGEYGFGYRRSELASRVILSAQFELHTDEKRAIQERIDAHMNRRRGQPYGERTSGCMFRNPSGDSAGRLIDAAGLKGLAVGGVSVSEAHANFMINDGTAGSDQIRELMELVRSKVAAASGVTLENEVRIISERG